MYRARTKDCRACVKRERCVPPSASARMIRISIDQPALLRARRRHRRWGEREKALYKRHRWRSEGVHGEAKTWHGLRRAARRRLWNVAIQAYLTAAVINLKRLAAALLGLLLRAIRMRHEAHHAWDRSPAGFGARFWIQLAMQPVMLRSAA